MLDLIVSACLFFFLLKCHHCRLSVNIITYNRTIGANVMAQKVEKNLQKLGIELPTAPSPAANYVPYVIVGKFLYVSGQISQDKNGLITGKLGKDLSVEEGANAAKYCALSLLAQVKAACKGDLDRLVRVIKLTGFVNSVGEFTEQPQVVNGASNILVEILGDSGKHSRSAVSAASLPLGVAVEIEGIFEIN